MANRETGGFDYRDLGDWSEVVFQNTEQTLVPGKEFSPAQDEFLLDSGMKPVELPPGSAPLTVEELDALYKETVAAGVIDHHFIDGRTIGRVRLADRKCASQMVYDYRHEVFSMIQAGRRRNNTHMSSDMDALVSSYLIQSMVQGRGDSADARLPAIAEDLVELTNLVDYGRYRTPDFKTFKESLVGIIGALRSVVAKNINYEFSEAVAAQKTSGGEPLFNEKGWRTTAGEEAYKAVCQKHDTILGRLTFKVLNIANVERLANSSMSLTECGSLILRKASPELRAVLEEGLEISRQQFENFEKEIVKGETIEINILTKEGFRRRILMTIISELDLPALSVINIGITLMPDRIFAGFAGPNRPSGDNYDLKVSTDVGEEVDLSEICIALNKAEAAARAKVLAKNRSLEEIQATPEDQRTLDEKKIIVWLTGNERFGQSGVSIPAEASVEEKRQLQIITRDPTVLVAGGSLIASSFTSVLSRQEFVDCLKSLK